MWIAFVRDIDVRITRCMLRAYRAGTVCFVHEKHAAMIIASGAGHEVPEPCR